MKSKFKEIKEYDVRYLVLSVVVNYEDEQMPYDFFGRIGDIWKVRIDIDEHVIVGWNRAAASVHLKVVDQGCYTLYTLEDWEVDSIINNYVPNNLIPGSYGDYIELEIDDCGGITNWSDSADFSDFNKSVDNEID